MSTTSELYREQLLEEASHPSNLGNIPHADAQASLVNASCGDGISVTMSIAEDTTISDLKWQGNGCIISQAAMSALSREVIGKKIETVQNLQLADALSYLGMESIAPGRRKCLLLGLQAVQRALL